MARVPSRRALEARPFPRRLLGPYGSWDRSPAGARFRTGNGARGFIGLFPSRHNPMDAQQLLGNPVLTAMVGSMTIIFASAVALMTYSIYRMTPELLQVQLFRKLRLLRNSVLLMGIGLIGGMILITVFVANVPLPDVAWGGGAAAAAILFWCGMFGYSRVFHVPGPAAKRS